jgi:hypothetical protein
MAGPTHVRYRGPLGEFSSLTHGCGRFILIAYAMLAMASEVSSVQIASSLRVKSLINKIEHPRTW